jgi:flavin-dependent dehydrogenase
VSYRIDVAVVGAGPAGSVCAAILAGRGLDVVLVDSGRRRDDWPEMLSPEACLTLERLGLSVADLTTFGRPCLGIVDAWDCGSTIYTDFLLQRYGSGWVLDRGQFDALLIRWAVAQGARVRVVNGGARLVSAPLEETQRLLLDHEAEELRSRFVVDATGMAGRLTTALYNRRLRYDRLVAVRVRLVTAPYPLEWMRLTASSAGWWYLVSPRRGGAQAVFLTDADLLPNCQVTLASHLDEQFRDASLRLGIKEGKVAPPFDIRDSRTTCRRRLWSGRWLPIGDAAYTIDPLSGSGVLRAVSAGEAAADIIPAFIATRNTELLQSAAVGLAADFSNNLEAIRNYYCLASVGNPALNGPFWHRRVTSNAFRNAV